MSGLHWQVAQIPFSAGINQRGDKRSQNPPVLDRAVDVEFDEIGGLRTRSPYGTLGISILGGGTLTNVRRLVDNGGELIAFTDTTLYSWDAAGSVWVNKATYLAAKTDEETSFATNADQVDCDRAELSNVVYFAWVDNLHLYVATQDKTSGATIAIPTEFSSGTFAGAGNRRPRLVALSTKVLLFFQDGAGNLRVAAFDPASPSVSGITGTGTSTVLTAASGFNVLYDVVRAASTDTAVVVMRRNPTTSYTIATVTAALTITTSTKARTCDGCIAVSVTPTGTNAQVVRNVSGTNAIVGDLVSVGALADVFTAQAIGSTTASNGQQIAACHQSVTVGGQYRCYVYWDNGDGTTGVNWVDDGNSLGTAAAWVRYVGLRSRAFDYNGHVYVWAIFARPNETGILPSFGSQVQNTMFLYRDDNLVIAKAAPFIAGEQTSQCRLPGVVATGSGVYEWCGSIRRRIVVGSGSHGYASRAPRNIATTFDSNDARRCVRLGRTLYITGGQLCMYDGAIVAEVGFPICPWLFSAGSGGAGGNLSAGTYAVKATYRRDNAQGERERSTTTNVGTFTAAALDKMTALGIGSLTVGNKLGVTTFGGVNYGGPAVEFWRTLVNPTADAPFYLVTSIDPAATSNPNRYLSNDPTSSTTPQLDDTYSDATLAAKENNPENGAVLEALAPPPCTIIAADQNRIYLAGLAGAPYTVWYSKQRGADEIAAFNDALAFDVPATTGPITALAFLNETLIAFTTYGVWAIAGSGFDNTGGGNGFAEPRLLSSDVGAVGPESIALTPAGLIFKSNGKGWQLLDRGWNVQYIGGPVISYDSEAVCSAVLVADQQQVRILTSGRMLIWDYLVNAWAEWSVSSGAHAAMWSGSHVYATASAIYQEQSSYSQASYGLDVETAWIKAGGDLQSFARVRRIMLLGEYRSPCTVRIRVARDYEVDGAGNWSWFDDVTWTATPAVVGGPLQVRHAITQQRCEAIKIRITVTPTSNGDAIKLTGIALEIGQRVGPFKRLPSAQKT